MMPIMCFRYGAVRRAECRFCLSYPQMCFGYPADVPLATATLRVEAAGLHPMPFYLLRYPQARQLEVYMPFMFRYSASPRMSRPAGCTARAPLTPGGAGTIQAFAYPSDTRRLCQPTRLRDIRALAIRTCV
jgi:hypothetical protein